MGAARRAIASFPSGRSFSPAAWTQRHRVVLLVLWGYAIAIGWYLNGRGVPFEETAAMGAIPGAAALLASRGRWTMRFRSFIAASGLLASSALILALFDGATEAYVHVFAVVALLSIYHDWLLLALTTVFVTALGLIGSVAPDAVLLPATGGDPWTGALIWGGLIGGVCAVTLVVVWFNERSRFLAESLYRQLHQGQRGLVSQLQDAERLKEELVQIVSHELRIPIAAISGFGQTLVQSSDRVPEEKQREILERILRNSERLTRIVDNLLEGSVFAGPGLRARAAVGAVVETALEDIRATRLEGRVQFESQMEAGLQVRLQPQALRLVLSNLLSNAEKFARPGTTVTVEARMESSDEGPEGGGGELISLSVANVGDPIPVEDRERIFEPFVQGDSSSTRRVGGIGLGLNIVRRVVEASGGWVELECGEATVTFRTVLPSTSDTHPVGISSPDPGPDGDPELARSVADAYP